LKTPAANSIKILGLRHPERYATRRIVLAALRELRVEFPSLDAEIIEVGDPVQINKYVQVLVLPSLVINEQVVCAGRSPAREEIVAWLREIRGKKQGTQRKM
jgi:hypothetical protein